MIINFLKTSGKFCITVYCQVNRKSKFKDFIISLRMNFAITGKKITTTQPEKKAGLSKPKPKPQSKSKQIRQIPRKPSIPSKSINPPAKIQKKKQEPKKQGLKIEKKQQLQKKEEIKIQKKEEIKIQKVEIEAESQIQKVISIQKPPMLLKQQEPIRFDVIVRYNHYKDKFPTQNNILKYEVIQNKYSFADVFKGNYQPRLQLYRNYGKYIEPETQGKALDFTWLVEEGKQYEITIEQDEKQESKYQKKAYFAPKQDRCPCKKNQRVVQLTKEMREMDVAELGGAKHQQLLEQRALQEILYS